MATRQRGRSSTKAPVPPPPSSTSGSTPGDDTRTAADVPGIDQTARSHTPSGTPSTNTGEQSIPGEQPAAAQVRFAGAQIIYKSREERIAESAYQYAEARGFAAGFELEDWLKAEKEVDALLSGAGLPAD